MAEAEPTMVESVIEAEPAVVKAVVEAESVVEAAPVVAEAPAGGHVGVHGRRCCCSRAGCTHRSTAGHQNGG
ncbi:hypothetical protein [Streptomyces sp. NPDC047453]|uniref:hypothetical protein n=1 Tax=Streptomyces sp. NPDC047453 TaxID=3154812 RepID=UPI0033C897B2